MSKDDSGELSQHAHGRYSQDSPAINVAPGWYPTGNGWQRYWDGARWTEHHALLTPASMPGATGFAANDNGVAVLAHLGALFGSFLVPLVIYLLKRDESPYLRHHAAEALNFQITLFFGFIVSFVLVLVIIGFFMIFALIIASWVFTILAAVAANRGEYYRYPINIRFVS